MSSNTKLADEYADIARRLKEIEQDKSKAAQDTKLPETVGEAAVGWPFAAHTDYDDFMG